MTSRWSGKDSFALDTLAHLPNIGLNLDIMSVISGNRIKVKSIDLERPRIKLVMLKSGKANWDISKDTTAADTAKSDLKLALQGWSVNKGTLTYIDQTLPMTVVLQDFDHQGSGDFEANVFDMKSSTQAEHLSMIYGGAKYIDNARLDADVTMGMDLNKNVYTFKENNVKAQ